MTRLLKQNKGGEDMTRRSRAPPSSIRVALTLLTHCSILVTPARHHCSRNVSTSHDTCLLTPQCNHGAKKCSFNSPVLLIRSCPLQASALDVDCTANQLKNNIALECMSRHQPTVNSMKVSWMTDAATANESTREYIHSNADTHMIRSRM